MNWIKIKKKLLQFGIEFILVYTTFQLTQESIDLCNHKQIIEYEDIIDDFVKLMKKQGIENPIEIFDYYNYALWNGYLSNQHTYQYNGDRDIFFSNQGLTCITGHGVCLNKADFLTSIYKEYGYDAHTILCYIDVDEEFNVTPIRTNSSIQRKVSDNKETKNLNKLLDILKPITVLTGNHAITCVEYEGDFYYLDSTNLEYLQKIDKNTMEIINGEGSLDIRYLTTMFFENISSLKIINNDNFDYSKLLEDDNVTIDLEKLEQFYNDNSNKYELVSKQLEHKNQIIIYIICSIILSNGIEKLNKKGQVILKKVTKTRSKEEINKVKKLKK